MKSVPRTLYTRGRGSSIAYQVVGDGPLDLIHATGWMGHVEAQWDYPAMARFLERLSSFSRVICFDRRGHGLSDPVDLDNMTLDQWMEDVRAVQDATDSGRAAILSSSEGCLMSIVYAATYPERTRALVLVNAAATLVRTSDYPWGMPESARQKAIDTMTHVFWDDDAVSSMFGSMTSDPDEQQQLFRLFRHAMRPAVAGRLMRSTVETDVRHVLPSVRVPTLVIHREDGVFRRVGHGQYLAENIAGARFLKLPGQEQFPWSGDQDEIIDEVQEFLTGVRPAPEPDRVLATVLFTDVVSSTERVVEAGDRRWKELLEQHKRVVRRELERNRGREVNTAGDGFLATFDGPARAVRCARAIVNGVQQLGLEVRAGVHTGEIELAGNDVAGIAVHIGSRVQDLAGPGEVLVSRMVTDLVAGSGLEFEDRGEHELKGVPGRWQLYAVKS
jgi:class 3 adenylate cyclase/pimeloyl-ACP methyl ester carboxylesterase